MSDFRNSDYGKSDYDFGNDVDMSGFNDLDKPEEYDGLRPEHYDNDFIDEQFDTRSINNLFRKKY